MVDTAKNSNNANVGCCEMKRLLQSLENKMQSTPKMKREKSSLPTNSLPTLPKALSVRRLWMNQSNP